MISQVNLDLFVHFAQIGSPPAIGRASRVIRVAEFGEDSPRAADVRALHLSPKSVEYAKLGPPKGVIGSSLIRSAAGHIFLLRQIK